MNKGKEQLCCSKSSYKNYLQYFYPEDDYGILLSKVHMIVNLMERDGVHGKWILQMQQLTLGLE